MQHETESGENLLDIICCNKKWSVLCCICRFLLTVGKWYSSRVISVIEQPLQLLPTNRSLPTRLTHIPAGLPYIILFSHIAKVQKMRFLVKVDKYSAMFFVLKILQNMLAIKISLRAI